MNEEEHHHAPPPFNYFLVALVVPDPHGVNGEMLSEYYGADWNVIEDGLVDVTRQEDALAQVGFYEKGAKPMRVAPHFTKLTPAAFVQTQLLNHCFVHVCTDWDRSAEAYRSQRKALRKERRQRAQKRLKFEEEEEASGEF